MKKPRLRTQTAGFSLVQTLVAAGVVSIVLLGTISMMNFSLRTSRSVKLSAEFGDQISLVKMATRDSAKCAGSMLFEGSPVSAQVGTPPSVPDIPVDEIKVDGFTFLKTNSGSDIRVTSMKLISVVAPSVVTQPFTMKLVVEGKKMSHGESSAVGGARVVEEIPYEVVFSGAGAGATIAKCSSFPGGTGSSPPIALLSGPEGFCSQNGPPAICDVNAADPGTFVWQTFNVSALVPPEANFVILTFLCIEATALIHSRADPNPLPDYPTSGLTPRQFAHKHGHLMGCFASGDEATDANTITLPLDSTRSFDVAIWKADPPSYWAQVRLAGWLK